MVEHSSSRPREWVCPECLEEVTYFASDYFAGQVRNEYAEGHRCRRDAQ
jgi:hypothetical protein